MTIEKELISASGNMFPLEQVSVYIPIRSRGFSIPEVSKRKLSPLRKSRRRLHPPITLRRLFINCTSALGADDLSRVVRRHVYIKQVGSNHCILTVYSTSDIYFTPQIIHFPENPETTTDGRVRGTVRFFDGAYSIRTDCDTVSGGGGEGECGDGRRSSDIYSLRLSIFAVFRINGHNIFQYTILRFKTYILYYSTCKYQLVFNS